jgi:hypothetical protein
MATREHTAAEVDAWMDSACAEYDAIEAATVAPMPGYGSPNHTRQSQECAEARDIKAALWDALARYDDRLGLFEDCMIDLEAVVDTAAVKAYNANPYRG